MGYASWRVLQASGGALPLGLYATQLALNFIWTPLFFKAHNLKAASYEITALWGTLVATILAFNKVDETAAALLLPYLAWTTFASALTWNIHLNNPDQVRTLFNLCSMLSAFSPPFLCFVLIFISSRLFFPPLQPKKE